MTIELRAMHPSDASSLFSLYYQIQVDEFSWIDSKSLSEADFYLSSKDEEITLVTVDGELAGFLSIWVPDKFIHHLFVSKRYRNMGIGNKLIQHTVTAYGLPLTLKCVKENERAMAFYLKNGWSIEEEVAHEEIPYYLLKKENR